MTKQLQSAFSIGVCDYPEHVSQQDWHNHAKLQKELGLSFVRLAEFSWAKIEPVEGTYNWQWLDDAIATYRQYDLNIVLGTPTATPPAWLIEKHPEILPVDEQGLIKKFGSRRHYDHASDIYRQHCVRIVTAMAQRYANHEAVIGWQTDNELGHEGTACSYGGASAKAFPIWLEEKYQSLDNLNQAWGCEFWSQNYTSWQQISPPNLTAVRQANPSHALDFKRFCSNMIEQFQQLQIDVLRKHCTNHFITHNCVIFSAESDLYALAKNLDFVSWDSYPIGMLEYFATWESEEVKTQFARTGHPDLVSVNHDIYRGLKNGTDFWVMEQQCGHANWAQYNPLPAAGAVQLWTAQAWAHGASSVVYFRWRACHMAQEIMHSGLLRHDGLADRGYPEVASLDLEPLTLDNANNTVALLHDYDSLWAYDLQPHNQDLSYWRQFIMFYSCLRRLGVSVDIIHPSDLPSNDYKLVVCPALTLISQQTADIISDYANTHTIVFGPRCGFRDVTGKVPSNGQYQNLRDVVGIRLANSDSLRPKLEQVIADNEYQYHVAKLWCESYELEGAKALAQYDGGPMDGAAAVTQKGNSVVIGALSESLIEKHIQLLLDGLNISWQKMPEGVRKTQRGRKTLYSNFSECAVTISGVDVEQTGYLIV